MSGDLGHKPVAVTFARYLGELVPLPRPEATVAVLALATLTASTASA